jgi:transcriptional regulator with XRE-family HTH domain
MDTLRLVRKQRGFSLQDVQRETGNEFKASVVGAYERGERQLTVRRLVRLAEVYGVPAYMLLPGEESPNGRFLADVNLLKTQVDKLALHVRVADTFDGGI